MDIQFENVSFNYGETPALQGLSLTVHQGEFVAIIGSNGSGKSTFAKLANALLLPTKGRVIVGGICTGEATDLSPIRKAVGMVFQNPEHQIVASLVENEVAFGPENLGVENPELRQRVTEALAAVGLEGFETRATHQLSGGQKQRLAIASVLAMQPEVIVLDEASAMLDPKGARSLMAIVRQLHSQGFTIVYITHNLEEAAQATRVVVLDAGRCVADGTPEEVLTQQEQLAQLGLATPFATRLSLGLQQRGVPVASHIQTHTLKEELCSLHSSK